MIKIQIKNIKTNKNKYQFGAKQEINHDIKKKLPEINQINKYKSLSIPWINYQSTA